MINIIHFFVCAAESDIKLLVNWNVENILVSYHYLKKIGRNKGKINLFPDEIRDKYPKIKRIFLDCGAFSSIMSGQEIDLQEYIDYVLKYQDYVDVVATLDPLWDRGRITAGTYENYCTMLRAGCEKLCPVWHGNEKFWFVLEEYCSLTDYILIGSACRRKTTQRIFREFPHHRFHGFAQTSWWAMLGFPYYSGDSSTWAKTPAFGFELDPHIRRAGLKVGYGASDLLDSKVNPEVRNYLKRREAFVHEMLRNLDKVELKFGSWKRIEPFQKDPNPKFRIPEENMNENLSLKQHKKQFSNKRKKWTKKRFEGEPDFKVEV